MIELREIRNEGFRGRPPESRQVGCIFADSDGVADSDSKTSGDIYPLLYKTIMHYRKSKCRTQASR